ncbi:MAG: hypothetical protein EBQ92_11475 [Proteobacteria bacterium]|nr:hypothetical protein [Pseudomonadota bacterium]
MKRFFVLAGLTVCFVMRFNHAQLKNRFPVFKNPGALSDALWSSEPQTHRQQKNQPELFSRFLLSRTVQSPSFSAVQLALWKGDLSGLPFWLLQKYREQGLLQVLALSGQHVWALALCFSCLGGLFWKVWPQTQGKTLFWARRFRTPLAAAVLFVLAPAEPSIARTSLCVFLVFLIQENPISIQPEYTFAVIGLFFFSLFPQTLFSKGFQLSLLGVIGVGILGRCFSARQKLLSILWLVTWFAAIMALFFGKWVGDSLGIQLLMGVIWDQVFLPILFLTGMVLLVLPPVLNRYLAIGCEKTVQIWLNWEAVHIKPAGSSIYRPSLAETTVFLLWLIALAYWNRERCQNVAKKDAYGATCVDLTRSARRQ